MRASLARRPAGRSRMTVRRNGRGSSSPKQHRQVRHVSCYVQAVKPNKIEKPPVPDGLEPGKAAGRKVLRPDVRAEAAPARKPAAAIIEIDHVSQIFQTSGRQNHL